MQQLPTAADKQVIEPGAKSLAGQVAEPGVPVLLGGCLSYFTPTQYTVKSYCMALFIAEEQVVDKRLHGPCPSPGGMGSKDGVTKAIFFLTALRPLPVFTVQRVILVVVGEVAVAEARLLQNPLHVGNPLEAPAGGVLSGGRKPGTPPGRGNPLFSPNRT